MGTRLHFDCFSGISGDMTLAALIDLGVPTDILFPALDSLALPGKLNVQQTRRAGLAAKRVLVECRKETKHRHLAQILKIIEVGDLTPGAKSLATKMFTKLAEAEAACHGMAIEKVHFHEVGAVDSIFDFVGAAIGIDWLRPDRITCGYVPTGSGWVQCEHGKMPVPAPAVARLLLGIPLRASNVEMELTTPTGAAIVAALADEFVAECAMTVEKIGIGAGAKDLPGQANVLRLLFGSESTTPTNSDAIWELQTNLDDASGEVVGYCYERLFAAGALDVFTQHIQMKKNRPGILLTVLCEDRRRHDLEQILFSETGTFGIRRQKLERTILNREEKIVETEWGVIAGKIGWDAGHRIFSPEFEACAKIAREKSIPLRTVFERVRMAFSQMMEARDQ